MNGRWLEPGIIATVIAIAATLRFGWPIEMAAGQLVLAISTIFLAQTLVRDLVLVYLARLKGPEDQGARREAQCFCVESGVGALMVVLGLILFLAGLGGSVVLSKAVGLSLLTALLIVNYLMKDMVFSWNPWRIYRDPDHLNIVPRFSSPRR